MGNGMSAQCLCQYSSPFPIEVVQVNRQVCPRHAQNQEKLYPDAYYVIIYL